MITITQRRDSGVQHAARDMDDQSTASPLLLESPCVAVHGPANTSGDTGLTACLAARPCRREQPWLPPKFASSSWPLQSGYGEEALRLWTRVAFALWRHQAAA